MTAGVRGASDNMSSEQALQRLRVLQAIAEHLNRTLELQPMLDTTLALVLEMMGLDTGWITLRDEAGHFYNAAARGLPPALEADDRALLRMWPCQCQHMLLAGELRKGVNIVQCERLQEWVQRRFKDEDPEALERLRGGLRVHASIPLRARDQVFGIMNLARTENGSLSQEELVLLSLIGEILGAAIQRARLFTSERHRRTELEHTNALLSALGQIAARLRSTLNPDDVLATVGEELKRLDITCAVALIDPEDQALVLRYTSAAPQVLERIAAITGVSPQKFRIPRERYYRPDVFDQGEGVIEQGARRILERAFPGLPWGLLKRVASLLGFEEDVQVLYLPLKIGDAVIGTLSLWGLAWREEDLSVFAVFASQVAAALEVARLHEQLQAQRVKEQEILLRLSQDLAGLMDPQAVMSTVTQTVREALQVEYVSLMIPDPTDRWLVLVGGAGWEAEMIDRYRVDITTSQEGHVFRTGEPVQQPDVQSGEPFPCPPELREHGVVSSVTVPLRGESGVLGILCAHSTRSRQFSADEIRLLSLIASQAAIALQRAREHQASKASEARYRSLFDGVPVGLYRSTPDGQLLDANLALVDMLGYPDRETLLAVNASDLYVDAEDRGPWQVQLEREGTVNGFETRLRRYDGGVVWVRSRARVVRDTAGRVMYYEGSIEDITARKREEATRRRAERRYRELFEEAPVMYVITRHPEGEPIIADCNHQFLDTLGYTRDEVIGRPLADFYTPESRARLIEGGGYQRALAGEFIAEERELVTRDGGVITTWLRAVPETDSEGRVVGTRAMFVDISALKQAERLLRRQRDRMAAHGRILEATLRTTDLDELLHFILDEVLAFLDAELGSILLVEGDQVVLRAWRGISEAFRARVLTYLVGDALRWLHEPRIVHERTSEPGIIPEFAKREGIRAWASIPLYLPAREGVQGEWLGALMVGSRHHGALDEVGVRALQAMGEQLALAIDHLRTFHRAQERLARLRTLRDIDRAIAQSLDLEEVLHIVLERVPRELGADAVAVSLLDETQQRAEVSAMRLPNGAIVEEEAFELAEGLLHWFVERQEPVIIHDLTQDSRMRIHRQRIRDSGLVSYLGVPLVVRDRTIGILHVLTTEARAFADEDVEFFHTMAGQAAIAIENARAFAEATARAERMARLAALSEPLNRPFTITQVVEAIGKGVLALSGADRAAVYLRHPDDTVTCPWSHRLSSEYLAQVTAYAREMPGRQLIARAEPVLISDVAALPEEALVRRLAEREGYRAIALWPLVYEGRVVAAMGCYYDTPHVWSRAEQEVMQALARQAAVALENAHLFESLQARLSELSTLAEASTALRGAATMQEVASVLASEVVRLIQADAAFVCLLDEEREQIVVLAATGVPADAVGRAHGLREGITGRVLQSGVVHRCSDLATDPLVAHRDLVAELGPGVCVPLRTTEGRVIGTLLVARRRQSEGRDSPLSPGEERLLTTLAEVAGNAMERARAYEELEDAYVQTVLALANAMDARDAYTANHSQQLAEWAVDTARELGCSDEEIDTIRWAALLHDIGKIGVPDHILRKPGPLDEAEWGVIKRHPEIGAEIVAPVKRLANVAPIIRGHQEHWDGTGYPDGLKGEAIPLGARILSVVDAYGAIIDERPYKRARSHEEAVAELRRCAGTQFDPRVVDAFLRVLER